MWAGPSAYLSYGLAARSQSGCSLSVSVRMEISVKVLALSQGVHSQSRSECARSTRQDRDLSQGLLGGGVRDQVSCGEEDLQLQVVKSEAPVRV